MKVLLLHQHFNTPATGGPLRSYYLACALAQNNIRPIVITTHGRPGYQVDFVDGLEIHYIPVNYDNAYGFYRRGWSFVQYMVRSVSASRRFRDASLCYAMSVPLTVGVSAIAIKALFGIPFVFEVGDLWPQAPVELGVIRNPILKNGLYGVERKIYNAASAVVALSGAIAENIKPRTHTPVTVVENMADTAFFSPGAKHPDMEKKYGVAGKFVVSYIGAAGYANGLEYLVEAAAASQQHLPQIQFLVCARGAMLETLRQSVAARKLSNITFVPHTDRTGVREVLGVSDANFICYRPEPILETGSPNKYFDGLAAGKLTIINFGGWIGKEIETEKCGVRIPADAPEKFVEVLAPFVSDRSTLGLYQKNARNLAERKYSRSLLTGRFLQVINSALA